MALSCCCLTTEKLLKNTILSKVNEDLLQDLQKNSISDAHKNIQNFAKDLLTQSDAWMSNELPFKVTEHPCLSNLDIEFIGSTSEKLSLSEISDSGYNEEFDVTAVLRTIQASQSMKDDVAHTYIQIEYSKNYPGFVLLKMHLNDNTHHWCGLCNIMTNVDGSVNEFYLSPISFTDEFFLALSFKCGVENLRYASFCKDADQLIEDDIKEESSTPDINRFSGFFVVTQEGPAVKLTFHSEGDLSVQYDYSLAIHCPEWPEIAEEFKHRARGSGFPSQTLVEQLTSMGCLIVPKYPEESSTMLEWRLSFCLVERQLMLSLTSTQRSCYLLFKAIWRQFLCPPYGKSLQSYHLKNIFLWECEKVPKENWTDERIVARVIGLLQRLQHSLFTGYCPNYILPRNNLFKYIDHQVLFYAAMRTQTCIFQSKVVWIENTALLYLPPHKTRTALGKELRNTCMSALKGIIEARVTSAVRNLNSTDREEFILNRDTIASLESKLEMSFNKTMAEVICRYIISSSKSLPHSITRVYMCTRGNPKQLLVASKHGIFDGIASIVNSTINWGIVIENISNLHVLETENLREFGYSDDFKAKEQLKLLLIMGLQDLKDKEIYCTELENPDTVAFNEDGDFDSISHFEEDNELLYSREDSEDEIYDVRFVCDECERDITKVRYHCKECDDFDLCESCFPKMTHNHDFEMLNDAGCPDMAELKETLEQSCKQN